MQEPVLIGFLDSSCITQMFPLLHEEILRDFLIKKLRHPATIGRVVARLLLPGSMEADEWLILARKKRNMWPMQMTFQVAALDVPAATFMQRERRRLKAATFGRM